MKRKQQEEVNFMSIKDDIRDYHANDKISASSLKSLLKGELSHSDTTSLSLGRKVHTAIEYLLHGYTIDLVAAKRGVKEEPKINHDEKTVLISAIPSECVIIKSCTDAYKVFALYMGPKWGKELMHIERSYYLSPENLKKSRPGRLFKVLHQAINEIGKGIKFRPDYFDSEKGIIYDWKTIASLNSDINSVVRTHRYTYDYFLSNIIYFFAACCMGIKVNKIVTVYLVKTKEALSPVVYTVDFTDKKTISEMVEKIDKVFGKIRIPEKMAIQQRTINKKPILINHGGM